MKTRIIFQKYQGTGNDFVMLDNINGEYDRLSIGEIQKLCDRKFGIGADGVIKINTSSISDFEVDYYNADGTRSFCGNGARCSVIFAKSIGIIKDTKTQFSAIDGLHSAEIRGEKVYLKMNDVDEVQDFGNDIYEIFTGSPHYLRYFKDLSEINIFDWGRSIRYNDTYKKEGINANAIQEINLNHLPKGVYLVKVDSEDGFRLTKKIIKL